MDSAVCIGLDPRPQASTLTHPGHVGSHDVADRVVAYFKTVLDACHDRVACCKPQIAFFEALGPRGLSALAELIAHARELRLPVLLDAKRGDIGSTAEAYACAYLEQGPLASDAITLNAYLGMDTLEPFLERSAANGRGLFVLVRTSNAGRDDLQGLRLQDGRDVAEALADALTARATRMSAGTAGYTALGAVLAAGDQGETRRLRERLPRSLVLVPGYGAQGGTADDAVNAFDANGRGAIVSASRSLTYLGGETYAEVARLASAAVERMRIDLDRALSRRFRASA